jgi:hypothetical protein
MPITSPWRPSLQSIKSRGGHTVRHIQNAPTKTSRPSNLHRSSSQMTRVSSPHLHNLFFKVTTSRHDGSPRHQIVLCPMKRQSNDSILFVFFGQVGHVIEPTNRAEMGRAEPPSGPYVNQDNLSTWKKKKKRPLFKKTTHLHVKVNEMLRRFFFNGWQQVSF